MTNKLTCEFIWNADREIRQKIRQQSDRIISNGFIPVFLWNLESRLFTYYILNSDPESEDQPDYDYCQRNFTYFEFHNFLAILSDFGLQPDRIEYL